jgi:hypothetical protein
MFNLKSVGYINIRIQGTSSYKLASEPNQLYN